MMLRTKLEKELNKKM